MLTNVLFGQPGVSASDPLSAKATEGPMRQQGNRSFSDHVDDRQKRNEMKSASQKDSEARAKDRANTTDSDRETDSATQSTASRSDRNEVEAKSENQATAQTRDTETSTADRDTAEEASIAQDESGQDHSQDAVVEEAAAAAEPAVAAQAGRIKSADAEADFAVLSRKSSGSGALADGTTPVDEPDVVAVTAEQGDSEQAADTAVAGRVNSGPEAGTDEGKLAIAQGALEKAQAAREEAALAAAQSEGKAAKGAEKTLNDGAAILRAAGFAPGQSQDAAQRRPAEGVGVSAATTANSSVSASALDAALGEMPQTGEGEAALDIQAMVRDATRKPGATTEAATNAAAATAGEPGRRALGRERESLDVQMSSTSSATSTQQSTGQATAAPQISAVQQAFVAQAMEADVAALGAHGDQSVLMGDFSVDSRGLSQILTEAALQPGTVHRPETPRQIGVQLATAFMAKGERNVDVALNPEELGRVKMRVSTSETGITMVIQTERPETADLMRRHINELADEFRKMGFDNISFEFSGEGAAAGGDMGDSDTSAGSGSSGLGGSDEDLALAEAADTAMQKMNLGNAGVDMRL